MIQDKYIKIANKIGQIPSDKWLHYIGGTYASQIATWILDQHAGDMYLGAAMSVFGITALAVLKEMFDVKVIKEDCQWSDVAFTAVGAIVGAAMVLAILI